MQPLEKNLRNKLERVVKDARDIAEQAARIALEQLGVGAATAYPHLNDPQKELRRRLRAHGRQLGDQLNTDTQIQEISRLVEEVAYEHWHRMLFARFLAENDLLMYPDHAGPVAITLEECEDIADEEGARNGWELASRYAARMLPHIFRPDSPVYQIVLPPEHQQKMEHMIDSLSSDVFTASDSIGWVYQFWQTKKKEEINISEVKIGACELPAVTQLFTEPYMVNFLLDNTLGAWWAARRLTEADLINSNNEEELRLKASIPGVPLTYLRFVKQKDGIWTPASGNFERWPENLAELKTLDPCCGSGHFLVAAFHMLVPMRMEREGLSAKEAVDAVLRENIHGLELDQRCVELAVFALALTAWKYPNTGGYRVLPEMNVACSGLSISAQKEDWLALAGDNLNLMFALDELYTQFVDAPVLGSLINPETSLGKGSLFELKWEEISPLLTKTLKNASDAGRKELTVVAKGLSYAAQYLASKYSLVFTNVPYLARGKQNAILADFIVNRYEIAKTDLAAVFMLRGLELLSNEGVIGLVEPQNWLYQAYYKKFREHLLNNHSILLNVSLGPGAFGEISGEVVKPALTIIGKKRTKSDLINIQDISESSGTNEKADQLKSKNLITIEVKNLKSKKDYIISAESSDKEDTLESYVDYYNGICSGDYPRFGRRFWEVQKLNNGHWKFQQTTSNINSAFVGMTNIFFWEDGKGAFRDFVKERLGENMISSWIRGFDAWGKEGIAVSPTGTITISRYTGELFDDNTLVLIPKNGIELKGILCCLFNSAYNSEVRKIDKALKVRGALVKVPINYEVCLYNAKKQYPNGLPKPTTSDPTQWIFHGHPCGFVVWDEVKKWTSHGPLRIDDNVLHIAIARLLGYRWPAELDPNMELADEQHEWVTNCEALLPLADKDGIVCIPSVRGERPAADRLIDLLAASYGESWSNSVLNSLLADADHVGKSLESWLRDKFFTQHCKLFQHRPFIWQIWDGLHDGFSVLVNCHKLDKKLLETLIYTYLGDWINRQKQDIANQVDGAQERLAAAERLKKSLELILEGEAPYDIFIRWKSLANQPVGWDPDINDGVRLNIRPFMSVPDVGKKGAGVMRDKPNINWNKDRGQDVESAPWYKVFNGDRINDYHLTLAEKRKAQSGM